MVMTPPDPDLSDVLAPFARERTWLLPALHAVQSHLGFLPDEALARVGRHLRVPLSEVYGVATHYPEFRLQPRGRHHVRVCTGVSCALSGGRELLDERIYGDELATLYVNAEDSTLEKRRRVWACCLQHGLTEQDVARFHLLGADDWRTHKLSFLRTEKGASVLDTDGIAFLETLLEALRPDVLVLDPLVALCGGGNMNDNAAMSLVMRALKRLANKFD